MQTKTAMQEAEAHAKLKATYRDGSEFHRLLDALPANPREDIGYARNDSRRRDLHDDMIRAGTALVPRIRAADVR